METESTGAAFRCWYCGATLVEYNEIRHLENAQNFPHLRTRDHMQPRSRGGPNRWKKGKENKVDCCQACNGTKANRTVEEFRRLLMQIHNLPQVYFFGEGADYESTRIFSAQAVNDWQSPQPTTSTKPGGLQL